MTESLTKTPMAWAAATLAYVCDEIDSADKIDDFLRSAFDNARDDLSDAVDRRIAFDRWVKIQIEAQEEAYRFYRERKALLESVHERFKQRTKEIMEATPELADAFRGKLGKISLCDSPPAVEYSFGTKEITPDAAVMMGVDPSYLIAKMTYAVDATRVKAELLAGQEIEWASLRRSKHVRFPAARKAKEIEG